MTSIPATTTGRLTTNTARQSKYSTSTPPRIGPSEAARPLAPIQMPTARARSRGSGKVWAISDSELGTIAAAASPWRARPAVSSPRPGASAQRSDAKPKAAMPTM